MTPEEKKFINGVSRRGVAACSMAIIGHVAMDIYIPSYPIFSFDWTKRTFILAWGIWVTMEAWYWLGWALRNGNVK